MDPKNVFTWSACQLWVAWVYRYILRIVENPTEFCQIGGCLRYGRDFLETWTITCLLTEISWPANQPLRRIKQQLINDWLKKNTHTHTSTTSRALASSAKRNMFPVNIGSYEASLCFSSKRFEMVVWNSGKGMITWMMPSKQLLGWAKMHFFQFQL